MQDKRPLDRTIEDVITLLERAEIQSERLMDTQTRQKIIEAKGVLDG
uniref:Uncharacterized protein n=1 Tax=viral metagenome TaxID=1070528 RepID=A0A6M3JH97_9ZZZZ